MLSLQNKENSFIKIAGGEDVYAVADFENLIIADADTSIFKNIHSSRFLQFDRDANGLAFQVQSTL